MVTKKLTVDNIEEIHKYVVEEMLGDDLCKVDYFEHKFKDMLMGASSATMKKLNEMGLLEYDG